MKDGEQQTNWGGIWTKQKLVVFEKYVNAYLTIMIAQRKNFNGWPRSIIYFDGFAGSGTRATFKDTSQDHISLEDLGIQEDESQLYQGSAERVIQLEKKFDEYYFVDKDKDVLDLLKEKLKDSRDTFNRCQFVLNDVNEELKKLSNKLSDKNKVALVLLDPFGMQIKWNSIELLRDKRIDIWILVPTGVAVNRLLDKKGKIKSMKVLEDFFGLSETEIREFFYKKENFRTLFGEEEIIKKVPQSIHQIAILYISRLKTIWKYVTEEPLVLANTKNAPIYHFVFASNNESALKIASQIIESKT
ncbi:MAG TPA: three-Cys-motif partner protein TcmP [Candidatus Hydrogenedens sp.]|nr:three-Cys-motif partner protein TcmP [Candidatus Hydrogenedens sp.]